MPENLDALWNDTLSLLAADLPRPSFEAWLRKTLPLASYERLLIVGVPNEFARSMAERHTSLINKHLSRCAGDAWEVTFVIPPEEIHEPTSAAEEPLPPPTPYADGKGPHSDCNNQPINPKYTFDTFVASPNSSLTYSASIAVADAPARMYNPLFIYGGVGLGKTHLLQAVANRILAHSSHMRIAYVSSETFTNELVNAIKDRTTESFRSRYRSVDVLLVDDVQFIAGKESTQEEFFHTFNRLYEAGKQIVLTCDQPPKEIATLEERLRSRFEWGLITDIQPPNLETRIAILRKKAEQDRLPVPPEAIEYIAEHIRTNIRELEGALIRVVAYASMHKREIDLEFTEEALREILPHEQPRLVTIRLIQEIVSSYYALDTKDFKMRRRTRNIAFPRQVAMYLCRELTDASLPRIGEEFGGRDHTTVIHACEKIAREAQQTPGMTAILDTLRERIRGRT